VSAANSTPPGINYNILLARHGESIGNAEGLHQGQSDFPLNETGWQQARALARRLKREKWKVDLIITSPLKRARETADILAHSIETPIEVDALWMERDR
jgi:uncharacterized phosphatase